MNFTEQLNEVGIVLMIRREASLTNILKFWWNGMAL